MFVNGAKDEEGFRWTRGMRPVSARDDVIRKGLSPASLGYAHLISMRLKSHRSRNDEVASVISSGRSLSNKMNQLVVLIRFARVARALL